MTAVCGCNHRHLPGQTHCYACGLPARWEIIAAAVLEACGG